MAASATSERLAGLIADAEHRVRVERGRNLIIAVFLLVLVYFSAGQTEFNPGLLVTKSYQMLRVLNGFVHPNLEVIRLGQDYPEGLLEHFALQTLTIALMGTFIGSLVAIPVSFLAARNLMRRGPAGTAVYFAVRAAMSIIRAIPTLFWGLLMVTAISVGPFAGVVAISIFSFGLMSKLFSEAIEAIDWGQVEALTATGADPLQVVLHGVVPQVMPYLVAHLLYTFEVNVHSASILGLVGAGGIGFLFLQYAEQLDYSSQAMLLYVVIVMTMAIDYSSAAIRRRII